MTKAHFSFQESLNNFKNNLFESKKYWIICVIIILISFFAVMEMENYAHPKMEIAVLLISCILSIFLISFYHGHRDEKNFYKTVFIIIFIFGIVFSFLTPIMCTHDEVEHFVRAEMTSRGIIHPEFTETPFTIAGKNFTGYYYTIQSTLDLSEQGKSEEGYYLMELEESSIFKTDADTQPINNTLTKFHSAFAQNPFLGYLVPAIGMLIAKLLDLNAIWLLWLGRIFNSLLYATLVSYAIKKTPILKMPLFVVACIPAALSQAASVGIDPLINGLGILSIALFLKYYKSPKCSLGRDTIIKFSIIVFILGLCKITYFSFIFLLFFIPKGNFKEKNSRYYILLTIALFTVILALWSKFVVNPSILHSWRYPHNNTAEQINFIITHKKDTLITLFHVFGNDLNNDLQCYSYFYTTFNSIFLIFTGSIYLLYPHEKINLKTRIGALLVFCLLYFGTYITFMVTWNPLGKLTPLGIQPRYFFPALSLIPLIFGFNHMEGDTTEIDNYIVMLTIAFIIFRIFTLTSYAY